MWTNKIFSEAKVIKQAMWNGKIGQKLRSLVSEGDLGSVPSTYLTVTGDLTPSYDLHGYHACIWCRDVHV